MRRLSALACVLALASILPLRAEIDARLMRYPDVSASQIAFTYAGDIWVVPKAGGLANRLSTPKGEESFARFSPDGRFLAFTGDYDGNPDVYVMPVEGGVPTRITHHPMPDRLVDWTPDGKSLIFASGMLSGRDRFNRLFEVSSGGGMPTAFPLPYGEFGALSPDGKVLAYQPISTEFRTWKRYRGGMTSEIWFYDLEKKTARRLPHGEGGSNDALPMWHGNTLYFLSDRDANKRNNLWSYDLKTGAFKQVTFFKEYDAHFPAIGPSDIVLEAGGKLYRVELPSEKLVEVKVEVATDQASLKPREGNASRFIRNVTLSPQGQRAVFEARGDLFSVPAEKGYVLDLTRTPGVGERFPALSPDGRQVAYFSDRSGDYELWVRPADGSGAERQVTHLGPGFRYTPTWSPDGKHVVFADQAMRINLCDVGTGKVTVVDKGLYMFEGPLENFRVSWSADSRWFAYLMDAENRNHVVVLYDTKEGKRHPVTSDFHDAGDVAFDPEGNYLFLLTGQHFDPTYSDLGDGTWVYTGTTRLAALPLRKDVASPLAPRNDADAAKADAKDSDTSEAKAKDAKKEPAEVGIDLDGLEGRMVLLPPKAGFLSDLAAVKGKVVYRRTGPPDAEADVPQAGRGTLQYYDLGARKEMTVIEGVDGSLVAAGGEKVLVQQRQDFAVLDLKPDQKIEKKLPTGELMMPLDPRAEWRQIFNDAWRQERDFFYDPGMHGVDWNAMRARYGKLIEACLTREDVNFVLGELIGELNSSHAYRAGGDVETGPHLGVGLLGADFALEHGAYRITRILRGSEWEASVKAPLAQPGLKVKEGDYLLAVNRIPLDPRQDPWAAFAGLAGKTVLLTVNEKPSMDGAHDILVETIPSEARLRYWDWVEAKRRYVDRVSGGKLGYIYVPDTGLGGQTDLVRQFRGQWDKPGLVIDERFNSGGQIPDRFIEMLGRKVLNYWGVRDGQNWQWPPIAHAGPMAMLINGWSGSGGDAFPYYFRKAGLGPLVGRRTWGGLIGISGAPGLIDGGAVTIPTFGIYSKEGQWVIEGHGVDPDVEVMDDPALLAQGKDPQLDRAIQLVEDALAKHPVQAPPRPAYPRKAGY